MGQDIKAHDPEELFGFPKIPRQGKRRFQQIIVIKGRQTVVGVEQGTGGQLSAKTLKMLLLILET
jgi:hypothetical protein